MRITAIGTKMVKVQIIFDPKPRSDFPNLEYRDVENRRDAIGHYLEMLKAQIPEVEFLDILLQVPKEVRTDRLYLYFQEDAEANQDHFQKSLRCEPFWRTGFFAMMIVDTPEKDLASLDFCVVKHWTLGSDNSKTVLD
jgi:hypothetical protein